MRGGEFLKSGEADTMKIDQKLNDLNFSIVRKVSFYPCYHYIYIELSVDIFKASDWPVTGI